MPDVERELAACRCGYLHFSYLLTDEMQDFEAVLGCFYGVCCLFVFVCASALESQNITAGAVELNSSFKTNSTQLMCFWSYVVAFLALL